MNLYGSVRADETIGTGKVTVILSMPWKQVEVTPTTHTLEIIEPRVVTSLPVSSRLIRSLPHSDRSASVWHIRFTPEGKLFTAGYPSGVVQIWDPSSGKEVVKVESPRGYRGSADYAQTSADFKTLFVPLDNRKAVPFEQDGKKRYKIEYNGEVRVWDLTTGKQKESIRPEKGVGVVSARVSPDGGTLCTAERYGGVAGEKMPNDQSRIYDTKTGKSWLLGEGYSQVAFSADSSRLYVSLGTYGSKVSGTLKVFDRQGKEIANLGQVEGKNFGSPILSPDGKLLAVTVSKGRINEPGSVRIYDLQTNKVIASFESGGNYPFLGLRFSPDGGLLAATDYHESLTIWDVKKNVQLRKHTFKGIGFGLDLAFNHAGTRLAVPVRVKTDADSERDPDPRDLPQPRVYLFDLATKGEPEVIMCPHGWAAGVAFSLDDKVLAFGSAGATHLFDVAKVVK